MGDFDEEKEEEEEEEEMDTSGEVCITPGIIII